jgi:hypothetical protein
MNLRYFCFYVASFLVGTVVSTAEAVVVFNDNFDGYANQVALEAVWTPIGCTGQGASCTGNVSTLGGTLSTDTAVSLPNSLFNHSPVGAPGTSDSSQRNQASFTATSTLAIGEKLAFSFDFYDITGAGNPYRQFGSLQTVTAPTLTNQLIAMGMNNNLLAADQGGNYYMARILGGASNGGTASQFFKLNDDGAPLRSAGWHNLKVEISTGNGTSQDYRFYVDNTLSETVLNVGTTLRQYEFLRLGAGVSSTSDANYDNVHVEFTGATAGVQGDYNSNGVVDAADYVVWRNGVAPLPNEVTGVTTGSTTSEDYDAWRARFGNTAGSGSSSFSAGAVPEPTTAFLMLVGAAALAIGRRQSRSDWPSFSDFHPIESGSAVVPD